MSETLFTRLVSYSQNPAKRSIENFTTEVLAHLINTDRAFRRVFLRLVVPDGRKRRTFRSTRAHPQQSFERGIVDLVLSSESRKILIEVKIQAAETQTKIYGRGWVAQVEKYLSYKSGPVVYLTTRAVASPILKSKGSFRHVFFEDLHKELSSARLTKPGELFMKFMEENDMKRVEPFTKTDLDHALHAFTFAKKCESMVDEVVAQIEPTFRKLFRTRARFTRGRFSPRDQSAYAYPVKFRTRAFKWLALYVQPEGNSLFWGIAISGPGKGLDLLNRHLGWSDDERGCLYFARPVRIGAGCSTLVRPVLTYLRQLKNAMSRA